MTLRDVVTALRLQIRCGDDRLSREPSGGYSGDMLSDVIAHCKAADIWVTMQIHVNFVAVAVLKELSAIVLVQGREPAEDTLKKAREEHIVILVSQKTAFEVVGQLYQLGIGKRH